MLTTARTFWPTPQSRDVGSYGNLELYAEALTLARSEGRITHAMLYSQEKGLGGRLRGLHFTRKITPTMARDLLVELHSFKWIQKCRSPQGAYELTEEGECAAIHAREDLHSFRRALLIKMHDRFVVPGWFIARLEAINPPVGEVILPAPPRGWQSKSRRWDDRKWTGELETQVSASYRQNQSALPSAFPVPMQVWLTTVRECWEEQFAHLSERNQYAPRDQLRKAMRRAAVELLFANLPFNGHHRDFLTNKHPIPPRSFQSWCPLLASLELIFYTDSHPKLAGRLIFPCAAFREPNCDPTFERVDEIHDLQQRTLHLHQPQWIDSFARIFQKTLCEVYRGFSSSAGTRYVSLLDVRDEVCRQLQLSAQLFDVHLKNTIRDASGPKESQRSALMISLESDIRPDQLGAHGLLRRPVYIDGIPNTLISISAL